MDTGTGDLHAAGVGCCDGDGDLWTRTAASPTCGLRPWLLTMTGDEGPLESLLLLFLLPLTAVPAMAVVDAGCSSADPLPRLAIKTGATSGSGCGSCCCFWSDRPLPLGTRSMATFA